MQALGDTLVLEQPPGCNCGERIKRWLAFVGLGEGFPYCAAWASYRLSHFGVAGEVRSALRPAVRSARARDFLTPLSIPARDVLRGKVQVRPGTIVVWRKGTSPLGHVGFALWWQGRCGWTIEANTRSGGRGDQREGEGVFIRWRCIEPFAHFRIRAFTLVEY